MSGVLVVQWTCDGVACGKVSWNLADGDRPTLPGDWVGTTRKAFCGEHAHLVHMQNEPKP